MGQTNIHQKEILLRLKFFRSIVPAVSPIVLPVAFFIGIKMGAIGTAISLIGHILLAWLLFPFYKLKLAPLFQLNYGIFIYFSIFTVTAFFTGGSESIYLYWLPSTVFIAGSFLPKKDFYIWMVVTFITCGTYFLMRLTDYQFIQEIPSESLEIHNLITSLSVVLIYGVFSYYIQKSIQRIETFNIMAIEKSSKNSQLTALGQMAGGVAHEINNPLMIMAGANQQIKRELQKKPQEIDLGKLEKLTDVTKENVARAGKVTKNLINLVKNKNAILSDEVIPLTPLIKELADFHGHQLLEEKIILDYDIPENLNNLKIALSEPILTQIITALVLNSYQAIKKGHSTNKWIKISLEELGKAYLIRVADGGLGISPEVQKNMFLPFYTTQPLGEAMGLGLTQAQNFTHAWDGEIYYELHQGHTSFVIHLPKKLVS